MHRIPNNLPSFPLFDGIQTDHLPEMLGCIGYHILSYKKGAVITLEDERINQVGIVLSGAVDMIKEDLWGNKTMLVRIHPQEIFGETFTCSNNSRSVVSFVVAVDAEILFLPFHKVMHTCSMACTFHHQLIENMVRLIAAKNLSLIQKVEVISKKTLREKILAYLSIQAQLHNSRYFELPLGRVELADYLCADRSALTRELSRMKEEGLIDYDRNMFRIL